MTLPHTSATFSSAIFVGTRAGLYRCQEGVVAPLWGGSTGITTLILLTGGQLAAGTDDGSLLLAERGGARWSVRPTPARTAITSLLHLPGPGPLLLAGTADGELLQSGDAGASFTRGSTGLPEVRAPLRLHAVPGRPRSALALHEGGGVWHSVAGGRDFVPWSPGRQEAGARRLAAHPADPSLWLALTATQVLRSTDGARSFQPVAGLPPGSAPRELHFGTTEPRRIWLATTPRQPAEPDGPSSLWVSHDDGLSFEPTAVRAIDRARDPSGEIVALASGRFREGERLVCGTDRGELLDWRGPGHPAELALDGLPPITALLCVPTPNLDPSTSGIFLLP